MSISDTTSLPINGKDGTADFTMPTVRSGNATVVSYRVILDAIRIREVIAMTSADVFANEGTADQEPGRAQIEGQASGIGKKVGPASGPMIGLSQPTGVGVPIVITFSTGCTLSFSANVSEVTADRMVNQNMRVGFRFLSKGVYVMVWSATSS